MKRFVAGALAVLLAHLSAANVLWAAQASALKKAKTPKDRAVEFCRTESLARLKYAKTIEWLDNSKEETTGVWLISGIRTAKAPSDSVDQQYACRVQITNQKAQLKMIQIFKESSRTGKDIFEIH